MKLRVFLLFPHNLLGILIDSDRRGNATDLYSRCKGIDCRPGHWESWEFSWLSLVSPEKCIDSILKLDHTRFVPCCFQNYPLSACLAYSSTLEIEAMCSSETSVNFCHATRCHIPQSPSCPSTSNLMFSLFFHTRSNRLGPCKLCNSSRRGEGAEWMQRYFEAGQL
jgi:hypothetical protein